MRYLTPRFSLRAMLVVTTLLALFLGYYLTWIHQRRTAREQEFVTDISKTESQAPRLLSLLGERGHQALLFSPTHEMTGDDRDRLRSLFPEAYFMYAMPVDGAQTADGEQLYELRRDDGK